MSSELYLTSVGAVQHPDWDELERNIFGRCEGDDAPSAEKTPPPAIYTQAQYTQALATALGEFSRWIVLGQRRDGAGTGPNQSLACIVQADAIAKRALGAAWILRPELFEGQSLTAVGKLPKQVSAT